MLLLLQSDLCAPSFLSDFKLFVLFRLVEGERLCAATLQPGAANVLSDSSEYRLDFAVKKAAVSL